MKIKNSIPVHLILFVVTISLISVIPLDAYAEDGNIFSTIRARAAQALRDSHQLVYLLAGFGLIGFAFMAIFNKISWKWFANIAIGLFLVAVMGMIISYFTGDDSIAVDLDFGYDMGANPDQNNMPPGIGQNVNCDKNPELCSGT